MKKLTEEQAWRVLAVMFDRPPAGLCAAIDELDCGRVLGRTTANRMRRIIRREVDRTTAPWCEWLTTPRLTRSTEENGTSRCETRINFAKRQAARVARSRRG